MKINVPKYFTLNDLRVSGIYFLIKKGKIVYIGQTVNLSNRLSASTYHPCRDYDYIRVVACDGCKMKYYERRWIIKFRPKYNHMHIWSLRGPHREKRKRVAINVKV